MSRAPLMLVRALTAAALGAAALSGCGDGESMPSDSVAKVGDTVIEKSDFDKWLRINVRSQGGVGPSVVPDPPGFTHCVEAKRRGSQPKDQGKPSSEQLKRLCKQEYEQLKRAVMQFLVEAEWIQQEAEAQNVKVSESEVKRLFEAQRKQFYADAEAYKRFLRASGMTEEEILYRMRLNTLQQKLNAKVRKGAKLKEPSEAEVREYYEKNKERFAQPELRNVNVVLTKTEDEARRAKAELQKGQSFEQVAKRFSIDELSKRQGGKLLLAKGRQSTGPGPVAFTARKGELQGPVKTPYGYYVFEVTNITPASQPSFVRAKRSVRNQLGTQPRQKAVDEYEQRFREKYRDKTVCADGFKVAECKNGPKR
jgi:foldase protein PrsA